MTKIEKIYLAFLTEILSKSFGNDVGGLILDYYLNSYYIELIDDFWMNGLCQYCIGLMDSGSKIAAQIEKSMPHLIFKRKSKWSYRDNIYDIYKIDTDKLYIMKDGTDVDIGLKCQRIAEMDTDYIPPGCSCCLIQDLGKDGYNRYLRENRIKIVGIWRRTEEEEILKYCDILGRNLYRDEYAAFEDKY